MIFIPWIITAAAVTAAVIFAGLFVKGRKKNQSSEIISQAINSSGGAVYIVLDADECIPLFVSQSITSVFGIDQETLMADICSLEWCVTDEEQNEFHKKFDEWDRESEYEEEFDFTNIETKQEGKGKVLINAFDDYLLIELQEISREIAIREELKNELERVKTEEKQKSDFLSKMSHEIRTPMNGILGMLMIAKDNIENTEEVLTCIDKANGLSQFLLSLINDILDLSKIESGKIVLEHEKFDFLDVFNKIHEMFAGAIEQKGIKFIMERDDLSIRYVVGDSLRLLQILINFVSNASKYTFKGGEIKVSFTEINQIGGKVHVLFKIKDNGKGMDPAFLSRIFKPFEQETASTTRKFGGTGLGMAIADNLVNIMGGHIVVDTALGRGSEFSVYIPFEIAQGEQSWEVKEVNTETSSKEVSLRGMCILMAEDTEINAQIATVMLEKDGAKVELAENGVKALEMFKNSKNGYYDIILMDIRMPEMDGWTATKEIRKLSSDYAQKIPIFALSANAFVEDKRHSVEVGMNGHISKPIDFKELKKVIGEAGRRH